MPDHLTPVPAGTPPSLTDADAAPPAWMPHDGVRRATERLHERLAELQAALHADERHALLLVFQGRDASGKDGAIRHVCAAFDPQGVQMGRFVQPTPLELQHDFLWRVHAVVPPRGMVGVFNRSHYESVLVERVRGLVPERIWQRRYAHINAFEELLADEGVTIVKFHLHVSRGEQRRRFAERIDDASKNWKFREGDLEDRALWTEYTRAYQDALSRCSTERAPWYVVPSDDKKARDWLIADVVVRTLESLDLRYPSADAATVAKWRSELQRDRVGGE